MGILQRSESRRGYGVRVLAVHTTEGGGTAQALRDASWWTGSSHALADEHTLLTPAEGMVPYDLAAWTLRSGNYWSENIELVGYASWTRDEWLARPGLLSNCARWLRDRAAARGIPLVKITAAQYRAGGSGVIGHVDHTVGYGDGTHWDPGPNFPYDIVIAEAQEDDVSAEDVWNYNLPKRNGVGPARAQTWLQDARIATVKQAEEIAALKDRLAAIEAKLDAPAEPPAA